LLFKTLSPAEAPKLRSELSDKQSRLIAYSIIFDHIHGKYAGKRRKRRKLPACVVIAVRDKWPDEVDEDDLVAAGYLEESEDSDSSDSDDMQD